LKSKNKSQSELIYKTKALSFKSDFTKQGFMNAVRKSLEHIEQGDIYQMNLSHRMCLDFQGAYDPFKVYTVLRAKSPNCFGSHFCAPGVKVLSSSPEMFLQLKDGKVQTRPMKGTRPRGRTKGEDKAFHRDLLKSPKEIAELLMVTDLERNDLGRVCRFGSVKVKNMRAIEKYKTVFQATSTVEGQLKRNLDGFDVLEACFPGGSVTGCPKLRAMSIIQQLEHSPRDLYTGSLGYMSFGGDMAFNILIRTLLLEKNKISFHVGSGIVADSDPEAEYDETLIKARAMVETLKEAL